MRKLGRIGVALWIHDDLAEPGAIAKIDEDETTVVATRVNPARERQALTHVLGARLATHHVSPRHRNISSTFCLSASTSSTDSSSRPRLRTTI